VLNSNTDRTSFFEFQARNRKATGRRIEAALDAEITSIR
jgi:hypothetical protein